MFSVTHTTSQIIVSLRHRPKKYVRGDAQPLQIGLGGEQMPRKLENLEFAKNISRSIAHDRKVPPATRIRALDRFCVLCKFYDLKMIDQTPQNANAPEELPIKTDLDRQVDEMLKRHKGEKNGD